MTYETFDPLAPSQSSSGTHFEQRGQAIQDAAGELLGKHPEHLGRIGDAALQHVLIQDKSRDTSLDQLSPDERRQALDLANAFAEAGAKRQKAQEAAAYEQSRRLNAALDVIRPIAKEAQTQDQEQKLQAAYAELADTNFGRRVMTTKPELAGLLELRDIKHITGLQGDWLTLKKSWEKGQDQVEMARYRDRQADGETLSPAELDHLTSIKNRLDRNGDADGGKGFLRSVANLAGEQAPMMGSIIVDTAAAALAGGAAASVIPGVGTASGAVTNGGRVLAARLSMAAGRGLIRKMAARAGSNLAKDGIKAGAQLAGAAATSYSSQQLETGFSYDRYLQEFEQAHGRPPNPEELDHLKTAANLSGWIKGPMELLPMGIALETLAARKFGSGLIAKAAGAGLAAAEVGASEGLTEGGQTAVELAFSPVTHSAKEWGSEISSDAYMGMKAGLLFGGPVATIGAWRDHATESHRVIAQKLEAALSADEQGAQSRTEIERLNQAAQEMPITKTSPLAAQELLQSGVLENDQVHAPAETFAEALSKVEPELVAQLAPDLPAQVEAARKAGHEVSIPAATYVPLFAAQPHAAELFARHGKTRKKAMSEAQAEEVKNTFAAELPELYQQAQAEKKLSQSRAQVASEIEKQLLAAGRPADEARLQSRLVANGYANLAKREGKGRSAAEYFAENPLKIESGAKLPLEADNAALAKNPDATSAALAYARAAESSQPEGMGDVREGQPMADGGSPESAPGSDASAGAVGQDGNKLAALILHRDDLSKKVKAFFEGRGEKLSDEEATKLFNDHEAAAKAVMEHNEPLSNEATFYDEVGMAEIGTWNAGIKTIHNHSDLARASAAIAADPQENMLAIATDAKGEILAVHIVTRGTLDRSAVHPRETITWLAAYPKAANLWLSHNHPSGDSNLSPQDLKVTEGIDAVLRGTHIKSHGLIAVANTGTNLTWHGYYDQGYNHDRENGIASPATGSHLVPHVKRQFIKQTGARVEIGDPNSLRRYMKAGDDTRSLILMLNTRNKIIGEVPFDFKNSATLRGTQKLRQFFEAFHRGSPARFIVWDGAKTAELKDLQNIAGLGKQIGIEMLDAFVREKEKYVADENATKMYSVRDQESSLSWGAVDFNSEYFQSQPSQSAAKEGLPWPADFPKPIFKQRYDVLKKHPDYEAAKRGGDAEAAARISMDLGAWNELEQLKTQHPDAELAVIHSDTSKNRLSIAYADEISERFNWPVAPIAEDKKASNTGANGWQRLVIRNAFKGEVTPGQEYIIVDDMITLGSSISEMRQHIEGHGGKVVAVTSLAVHRWTDAIAITPERRLALSEKFGDIELSKFLKEIDLYAGNIEALTDPEAQQILVASSVADLRLRVQPYREKAAVRRSESSQNQGQKGSRADLSQSPVSRPAAPKSWYDTEKDREADAEPTEAPPRGSYLPAAKLIRLFEGADKSTFLHESAHHFLHLFEQMATQDGAAAELKADMQLLRRHFGVETFLGDRNAHEAFAETFEHWLASGKAADQLGGILSQFRDWLKGVYLTLKQIGHRAKPSPEVADFYARLFAADEASSAQSSTRLEVSPAMTLPKAQKNQLATARAAAAAQGSNLMDQLYFAPLAKEADAEAERRDALSQQYGEEIRQSPAWQLLGEMRDKKLSFDSAAIEARYGKEALAKLPSRVPPVASPGGTLELDEAAQTYGFGTADKLIEALAEIKPIKEMIADRVAKTLREEDPLAYDAARRREAEARAVLQGDAKASLLSQELLALGGKAPGNMNPAAYAYMSARAQVMDMPGDKLGIWRDHARAETRAGAEAARLIAEMNKVAMDAVSSRLGSQVETQRGIDEIRLAARQSLNDIEESKILTAEGIIRISRDLLSGDAERMISAAEEIARIEQMNASASTAREAATADMQRAIRNLRQAQADAVQNIDAATRDKLNELKTKAAEAKRRQLLHFMLAREASKAQQQRSAFLDEIFATSREVFTGPFDERPTDKQLAGEYREAARGLLAKYGLLKFGNQDWNAKEFARAVAQPGLNYGEVFTVNLPDSILDAEPGLQDWKKLDTPSLDEVKKALDEILAAGKRKADFLEGEELQAHLARKEELLAQSANAPKLDAKKTQQNSRHLTLALTGKVGLEDLTLWQKLKGLAAALLKPEEIFRALDGQKQGAFTRLMLIPFSKAEATKNDMLAEVRKRLQGYSAELDPAQRKRMAEYIEVGGKGYKRSEILAAALNIGNPGNKQKLIAANFQGDEAALDALLLHMETDDWHLVQKIWDDIEAFQPQIDALHRKTTGRGIGKVKAVPFTVISKGMSIDMRGGYYPVVFDPNADLSGRIADFDEEANMRLYQSSELRADTWKGHTKGRTKAAYPILLDLAGLTRHYERVIHDLTHREASMQVMRLIEDKEVRASIEAQIGRPAYMQLRPWVESIAKGAEPERGMQAWEWTMRNIRQNATVMALGLRLKTSLVQFAGYTNGIEILGAKWMMKGFQASMTGKAEGMEASRAEMLSRSGHMRHRQSFFERDIADATRDLAGETSKIAQARRAAFYLINEADRLVTTPIWWGGYLKHLDQFPGDADGASEAGDAAVRLSQGAGERKDLPAFMRGNEFMKLFTMFYTPANAMINRLWASSLEFRQAYAEDKTKAAALIPTLMLRYWWLSLAPSAMLGLLAGKFEGDDDDERSFASTWFNLNLNYTLGGIPGVREAAPALLDGGNMRISPAFAGIQAVSGLAADLRSDDKGLDWITGAKAAEVSGYVFGLPIDSLTRYVHNILHGAEADANPLSPAEWFKAAVR